VAAPEEQLGFFRVAVIGLGNVDAVDGLGVKHPELAKQVGGLNVVDLEPSVFAGEEEDMVGSGLVQGESSYGIESITML
jgi:hypothetical protein